jgi:hypothetical protein
MEPWTIGHAGRPPWPQQTHRQGSCTGFSPARAAHTGCCCSTAPPPPTARLPAPVSRRTSCRSPASSPPCPQQLPLARRPRCQIPSSRPPPTLAAAAVRLLCLPQPSVSSACGSHRARCRHSCPTRIGARCPRLEMLRVTRAGDKRRGGWGRRRAAAEEEDARRRGREGEDVRAAGFLYVQRSLPVVQQYLDYLLTFIQ